MSEGYIFCDLSDLMQWFWKIGHPLLSIDFVSVDPVGLSGGAGAAIAVGIWAVGANGLNDAASGLKAVGRCPRPGDVRSILRLLADNVSPGHRQQLDRALHLTEQKVTAMVKSP